MPTATLSTPPGPRSRLPLGQLLNFRRDPLGFLMKLSRDYGELAYFKLGPVNICMVNEPNFIKEVLVTNSRNFHKGRGLVRAKRLLGEGLLTSEDDFHLRQRRLAQPAFHRQRINAFAETMINYSERAAQRWQDGQMLNVHAEMMRLTLAIVGKTLFDADVESDAPQVGQALADSMALFDNMTLPFSELLEKLPLPSVRRFEQAKLNLDGIIYRMINARRAENGDRGDLLSLLLTSQDTEGDGGRMSDEQLRDESMTIFLAGHETTANALTWTWYLLSQHPEVEAKLHAELETVLQGRLPTLADLPRLAYTEMVLAEAMRLYPPAWILGRRTLNDFELGGYTILADTIVLMPQYVMHHNPRYYPDPERFDPERFQPAARESRPKFAYFPFGGGPRLCIGESFAWMEGVLLLAVLAQKWQFRLAPGHSVEMQPLITLRPKNGMPMSLTRRS